MQKGSSSYSDITQHRRSEIFKRTISVAGESVIHFNDRAVGIWLSSAVFWMVFVTLAGFSIANELVSPNLFGGVPWMVFSRVRPIHVNGVIFAWLTPMYWGAIFYITPRLTGRSSLWGWKWVYWTGWIWNFWFAAVVVTLASGFTQGREYWEIIWPLDIAWVVLWGINTSVVIGNVLLRRVRPLYVSLWWFLASPIWLFSTYIIANAIWIPGNMLGNGVPGGSISGAFPNPLHDAMANWWGSHNLFGLWLTPMLIGIVYYLVPRLTGTPLYSHLLSLLSFWGLAFFYSGVGHHHILQAPIPDWLRTVAVINSVLILTAVIFFFANIWATMRGNWDKFFTNLPLRFTITGFLFYILVNIQGAGMAIPEFNNLMHFTNWTIAHAHLALLGGFSILGQGVIAYMIPQITKRPLWSSTLLNWQYYLITIGFSGFFLVLTFASFLQGQGWEIGMPVVNTVQFLRLHYIMRAFFGCMIFVSSILQATNIVMTFNTDTSKTSRLEMQPYIKAGQD